MSADEIGAMSSLHNRCNEQISSVIAGLKRRSTPLLLASAKLAMLQSNYKHLSAEIYVALRQPPDRRREELEIQWNAAVDELTAEISRQSKVMTTQLADSELYIKQLLVINDTLWNIRSDAGIDRRLLGDALRPNNPTVDLRGLDHAGQNCSELGRHQRKH
jgi:hypothetical protein